MDLIELQPRLVRKEHLDRVERRIDRAVAGGVDVAFHPVDREREVRLLRALGAADDTQPAHLDEVVLGRRRIVRDQRHEVVVIDLLLAVGERLEAHEHVVELVVGQIIAQIAQLGAQRRAARMLAHGDVRRRQADVLGAHDLEGGGVLQHAVLMDAAFVQKGVLAHHRLVELDRKARHRGDEAADLHDPRRVDVGAIGHDVVAHLERHHHLFERGVPRPLSEPVDRAFDLARTGLDRGQRVRRRHAEVVVAMRREDDRVGARHAFAQHRDEGRGFARRGIAHRVGDVDRARPRLDRGLDHAAEEIMLGPRRVHRRPLHVVAQVAGVRHRLVDARDHPLGVELGDLAVQGRGADEGVDARLAGVAHGLPAAVDIGEIRAREPADDGVAAGRGDGAHRLEIAGRGDGKARLDDVDAHLVEKGRDLELFLMRHGRAGGLFAVAQRGVEDQDAVLFAGRGHGGIPVCRFRSGGFVGACHLRAVAPEGTLRGG